MAAPAGTPKGASSRMSSFDSFEPPPLKGQRKTSSRPTSAASTASGQRRRQQRAAHGGAGAGQARPQSAAVDRVTHSSQTPIHRGGKRRGGKGGKDKYAYSYWGSYSHPNRDGTGKKKKKVMFSTLKRKKKRRGPPSLANPSNSVASLDSTSSEKVFNADTQYWLKHTDVLLEHTIEETKKLAAVERQIGTVEKAIREYRLRLGGVMAVKENDKHVNMRVAILEARLLHMDTEHMHASAHVRRLRKQIDTLRFHILYEKKMSRLYKEDMRRLRKSAAKLHQVLFDKNAQAEAHDRAAGRIREVFDQKESVYSDEFHQIMAAAGEGDDDDAAAAGKKNEDTMYNMLLARMGIGPDGERAPGLGGGGGHGGGDGHDSDGRRGSRDGDAHAGGGHTGGGLGIQALLADKATRGKMMNPSMSVRHGHMDAAVVSKVEESIVDQKSLIKQRWKTGMRAMVDTRRVERASSWKEAFDRVQKGTNTEGQSVEEFVKRFKDAEDKNFDLVMYINHVQEERRSIEDDIARVEHQNEELQKMYSTQDNSRQRIMQHMQERLDDAMARAKHFSGVAHGNDAAMHTIKRGLSHVLSDLGTGAFGKTLDTSLDALNPTNLMTHVVTDPHPAPNSLLPFFLRLFYDTRAIADR